MRFIMVDKIVELEKAQRARGIKNISWDSDFLYQYFPDITVFSPVILAESVAQLVSWIIIESADFTVRPVITVVDSYQSSGHAVPGDSLELVGTLSDINEQSALAEAFVLNNGKEILRISHAVAYLYPITELEDPEKTRIQFRNLYDPDYDVTAHRTYPSSNNIQRENIVLRERTWIDRVLEPAETTRLAGIKNISATSDFFNDHFPLKPVFPGVMIMEAMISLSGMLAKTLLADQGIRRKKPVVKRCNKIKFRKFILPGDQLFVETEVKELSEGASLFNAKIRVGEKPAASASVEFVHLDREQYLESYF